jgi:hypothetical protein
MHTMTARPRRVVRVSRTSYVICSQLPPFLTYGRDELREIEDPDKYGGHIPLSHVLWLIDDLFRMGTEQRPQVHVSHMIRNHHVACMCSSSIAVYVPVLPRSAPAPQILHVGYDVAFGCKVAAGDNTVDVTVLTVGVPKHDHKEAAQRRLKHAHEVSEELHNMDMDLRLAWLSRGIPLWIADKGSSYDERDDRDGRPVPGSQHSLLDTQPTAPKAKTPTKSPKPPSKSPAKKSPAKSAEPPVEPAPEAAVSSEPVEPGDQPPDAATPDDKSGRKSKRAEPADGGKKRQRKRSKSTPDKVADEHDDQHASDTPDEREEIKQIGGDSESEGDKRTSPRKNVHPPSRYGDAEPHAPAKRSSGRTTSKPSQSAPKGQTTMATKLGVRMGVGLAKPQGGKQ